MPGLLGMGLMGGGLWGVGFVTVDMRIRKLLKRFLATPMREADFLLGADDQPAAVHGAGGAGAAGVRVAAFRRRDRAAAWRRSSSLILLGRLRFAGIGLLVASRAQTMKRSRG